MSYAPLFAPEALAVMRQMPIWLQERTLDEVERLAEDPSSLVARGLQPGLIHDFIAEAERERHYVFLVVDLDSANRRLIVNVIGHFARVLPESGASSSPG